MTAWFAVLISGVFAPIDRRLFLLRNNGSQLSVLAEQNDWSACVNPNDWKTMLD